MDLKNVTGINIEELKWTVKFLSQQKKIVVLNLRRNFQSLICSEYKFSVLSDFIYDFPESSVTKSDVCKSSLAWLAIHSLNNGIGTVQKEMNGS
jgi:hypothetical protein